ncbi:3-phosphoshikimate 1-carboxyvinyltransferase [Candidatus Blochmanniella vafra str. BVAF]|uniref:3-phosphoshikimate 1-carboxyvinyltransferase n=1 Tax=Blochmanniella vafra (strain BVAF) TaxID=859654 RepID=E8Q684_BLOVB|nr:3-phosphoshikimate 1-carboxyvinyltransferase [Candidatus Blochmannia vafer]ADV33778.1 3-phosphoshikimate 1-carboxyvinyltransferase [Candidatus Blochmannia vafer str. BVAF]
MNNFIKLDPIYKVNGTVSLPGSKSISNRALLLAAQSVGTTRLINLLDSDDVQYMLNALYKLGIQYKLSSDRKICEIDGIGGPLQFQNKSSLHPQLTLFLGNAGTVVRPLIAALSIVTSQNIMLTGDVRMQERPIHHLIHALRQGGSQINYLKKEYHVPVCLNGGYRGGTIIIQGNISSQFLSSILMMIPLAPENTCIKVDGKLVSKPYIDLTLSIMKIFGITIQHQDYKIFYCEGNRLYVSPKEYIIEGDASSASYFLAASAIKGGTVKVLGIDKHSKQGDVYFSDILNRMGAFVSWGDNYIECTRGTTLNASIDIDVNHMPDAAMTLAIIALFTIEKKIPMILRNIYNWRVKESDRLYAMATELRKVGAKVIEGYDYLYIFAPQKIQSAYINTYHDHRIAMCFSLIALSGVSVIIDNPQCICKTFPDFFNQFFKISNTQQ